MAGPARAHPVNGVCLAAPRRSHCVAAASRRRSQPVSYDASHYSGYSAGRERALQQDYVSAIPPVQSSLVEIKQVRAWLGSAGQASVFP